MRQKTSQAEIVASLQQDCRELERLAKRMGETSKRLYSVARTPTKFAANLSPAEDRKAREADMLSVRAYTLYATTFQRLAGILMQGVQRSKSSEKLLSRLVPYVPEPVKVEKEPIKEPVSYPEIDPFTDLYGDLDAE